MWSWKLLRAGSFRLDGGGMFGVIPKTIWSKLVEADQNNRIGLQTNCLLLDDGTHRVLVEAGFGDKWSDKERGFWDLERRTVVDALREAGCEPEAISHVVVTHLHFDHAAALTRLDDGGNLVSTFPNAAVFVQKTEWEDALANKSTMGKTYLRSHVDPIAAQVRPVDGEQTILPGLRAVPMSGHTWGHQAVCFDDEQGVVCFSGDVMPTIHHAGPAYNMAYDVLPHQNMLTKTALLERAAAEGWRLVLDHEPGDPVVRVEPDPERAGRFNLVRV
ncbi:MAG: MBL fold metallo-hydrolase [Planctomycetota bacterium]|jgi:glyoxylase-like metal-dependent hydrolase (beta-lactamase superfamily II)